jgi:hypothetical protein
MTHPILSSTVTDRGATARSRRRAPPRRRRPPARRFCVRTRVTRLSLAFPSNSSTTCARAPTRAHTGTHQHREQCAHGQATHLAPSYFPSFTLARRTWRWVRVRPRTSLPSPWRADSLFASTEIRAAAHAGRHGGLGDNKRVPCQMQQPLTPCAGALGGSRSHLHFYLTNTQTCMFWCTSPTSRS